MNQQQQLDELKKTVELMKAMLEQTAGQPMPRQRAQMQRTPERFAWNPHPSVIACHEPDSLVAEQYRKLKTTILKITKSNFRNLLMVTSAVSGEGKSVTSANLAVMLAKDYSQSVLLVDASLRRPSLHEYFGIEETRQGLVDCIEDNLDPAQVIVQTGIPRLSLLPAGRTAAVPAEVLSSQRFHEILKEFKHRYQDRYVLLDTPPALLFSDPQVISAHVDGVIAVVKEGAASIKSVREMLNLFPVSSVLGLVFNDGSVEPVDAHYHHEYVKSRRSGRLRTVKQ